MDPGLRFRLESMLLFLVLAGFVSAASLGEWFAGFDRGVYDLLLRVNPPPLRDDLVIVGIDERSLARYGRWPWSRDRQARLLEAVGAGAPRAVLVDVVYAGTTTPQDDAALVDAVAGLPLVGLPLIIDSLESRAPLIEVLPFPDLVELAPLLGHVHLDLDPDAVARGTYLYQGIDAPRWPHLALAMAAALGHRLEAHTGCSQPEHPTIQNVRCDWVYVPFVGPPGTIPELSAADVLAGRLPPAALEDRIVLVGVTATAGSDRLPSPLSGDRNPMSGIELNANLLNGILGDTLLRRASLGLELSLALGFVALPALLLPRQQPKLMLLIAMGAALLPLLAMALAQVGWRLHLPLTAAAFAALAAYPYWSWRRHEIAWHFVATEMSRISVERGRWTLSERATPQEAVLDRLAAMVAARWRWAGDSSEDAATAVLRFDRPRPLLFERQRPFDAAERDYVARVVGALDVDPAPSEIVPGERLAARIGALQHAAEEARAGRDVGLRGLAEMPNGVAVLSAVGEVLFVNDAAQRLLGLASEELPSDYRALLKALVPPLGRSWREVAASVVIGASDTAFETQNRGGVSVLVEAAPLAHPGEVVDYWVITVTDMTDIRAAERDREEALAFLSHDLRSPMLSVLALVRDADYSPTLADIGRYAEQALSASEQFLQLSRVQAREQFETYPLNLVEVLRNATEHMFVLARERQIALVFEPRTAFDEDGLWVMGNGELLERAFVNLLSNAVKYSEPGTLVRVEVGRPAAGRIAVDVVDQGIGIDAAEQNRVFEPYFRSAAPALAERRGAGLGLRFVRTVVHRHGGEVLLESRPGTGSRFTVILPELEEPPA